MTAKRRRGSFWLLLVLCVAAVGPSGFLHWHNRILPSTWSLTHNMTAQQGLPSSLFYPNNIRLRQNWDFSKGGIVLHVHIPKTGGMTIRDFVYKNDVFRPAVMADSYSGFQRKSPILDSACVNGTRKKRILFFEIHGTDAPSMVKLRDQIHAWRETALANGVAFFAFSSIREPVSLALSHFNFFHSEYYIRTGKLHNGSILSCSCSFFVIGSNRPRSRSAKTPATRVVQVSGSDTRQSVRFYD